ncbi:MAG: WD40 repeat domain-containing protein, partial [Microcoleaceae cyanobacterium]
MMNTETNIQNTKKYAYQVGGVLPPDHPTYVVRPADRRILEKLIAGEYCYLMSSPQTGKSSLVLRTIQALQTQNIACITLNMNKVANNQITLDEWYDEVLQNLGKIWQITNHHNKKPLWLLANDLTPAQRFLIFIEEVLLIQIPRQPIIILIDEIDQKQVNYPLTDLVNIVTHCYEKRWHDENFRRITFGLFGRDIPEKLLTFCQPVEFTRFSWQEINSLLPGIAEKITNSEQIINEILYWTEGQPLLTQKLCSLLINYLQEESQDTENNSTINHPIPHDEDTSLVEELVRICVIEHWESQDLPEHFQIIRDRLMLNKNIINLLELYQQVLHPPVTLTAFSAEFETVNRVGIVADQSEEQRELIACGLVRNVHGVLQAYNPIYEEIFNHDWIKEQIERIHHFLDDDLDNYSQDNYLSQPILQPTSNGHNSSHLDKIDHRHNTGNHQNSNNDKILLNDQQSNFLPSLKKSNLSQNNSSNNLSNSHRSISRLNSPKIRWLSILAIASIIAVFYGIWSQLNRANKQLQQAQQQLAIAQKGTQLERQGANALQQFNSNQLPALLSAMQAGMELNTLVTKQQTQKNAPEAFPFNIFSAKKSQSSSQKINPTEYPSTSPILALQQILDQIHEKQQLKNIRRINYSPDGQWLGSIQTDGTAEILTVTGQVHAKLRGHQGKVTKIVFSPNNQYIATAGEDGTVRIWEKSGRLIGNFAAHQGNVWDIVFSPDSANFASGGEDGMVQLGSINNANLQKIHAQDGRILDVTFSPDGEKIASASWDGTVKISNINGTKPIILRGHEGSVEAVQFNPDGESIVTAGWDGTVRIWNNRGKQQAKLEGKSGGVWTLNLSPSGEQIVTSGEDGNAYIWDNTGEQLNKLSGHQGMITSVIYSPDGQYISTADSAGVIRLWTNTGRLINLFNGHQGRVWDMNFSPNSQQLLTVGEDNIARIWQLKEHYLTNLPGNQEMFGTVNFSPDGQLLATGGIDGAVRIWDIQGKPIARFKGYLGMFQNINFSPDHQLLVTAGDDGPPRLWQISGKEVRAFTGGEGAIHLMRFSPDGKTLVSVNDQGNITFWNQDGKMLKQIKTNQGKILDVNFSPDGQFLATAGSDRTGRLWDINGG